jgi:hypothetical protein
MEHTLGLASGGIKEPKYTEQANPAGCERGAEHAADRRQQHALGQDLVVTVESEHFAKGIRIAAEIPLPRAMAENDDPVATGHVVAGLLDDGRPSFWHDIGAPGSGQTLLQR